MSNIITAVDSYKVSMWKQYPKGTEYVSSYIEARGAKDPDYDKSVFFGLQYFLKKYLEKPITLENIEEAKELFTLHGEPFNEEGWKYILNKYNGYLPLKIESVNEGTVLPLSNVLVQITNTDPKCFWLVSYIETALLRSIWYGTTVATNSYTIKQELQKYYDKSGSIDGLDFKLHDFGARGVSSGESAGIGGLAHLINFKGTDTVESLLCGRKYYNIDMAGYSIPASEHSNFLAHGKNKESEMFELMIDAYPEYPMVACVSDTWDIYNAAENIVGTKLKQKIIDSGKTFIVRPDSGDPSVVPIEVIKILMKQFGYTTNDKGYKTLPKYIRVIQGDGITKDSIKDILVGLEINKLSLDNIAFGMGSGMLQQVNRDTLGFAMKVSQVTINGESFNTYKNPVHGGKKSKEGIQYLYNLDNNEIVTTNIKSEWYDNLLITRFNNEIINEISFEDVIYNSNN